MEASAAKRACECISSGKCLNTSLTSLGYIFRIASALPTAIEQYGHWKSENSTSVTLALAGPLEGAPFVEIAMGSSSNGGGGGGAIFEVSRILCTSAGLLPAATLFRASSASARL